MNLLCIQQNVNTLDNLRSIVSSDLEFLNLILVDS